MDDNESLLPSEGCEVEEGPLEESLQSPRFYNLTVEETQDLQEQLGSGMGPSLDLRR